MRYALVRSPGAGPVADPVVLAFTALGALSFLLGLASVLGGVRFRWLVRRSRRRSWNPFAPPAAVIVAAKGVDPGLDQNIDALLAQDYPEYRVIFALDDMDDPAHEVIRACAKRAKVRVFVATGDPAPNATGKAAALRGAAKELTPKDEVLAFMDSDARPPPTWLRDLVAPLQDPGIGATTTYRWYAHDRTLPSATRSAWNAAGTNILFSERLNFAWGGSYAIRSETFAGAYVAAKWGTALSDDMVVTQAVKGLGLHIRYVPQATVITDEPCDWATTLEWTTRQTVMMRAYDPRVTRYAGLSYATIAGSIDLGFALMIVAAIADPAYWLAAVLLLSHFPFAAAKSALRLRTFRRLTGKALGPMGAYVLGSFIVPWLTLYNLNVARKLRVIAWRGILYELRGPPPIRVVRR